uniref:Uncharacterized protein n=1 Tax=Globodera rostochiensis TaxID=31243 RepID=A0A914GTU0_GLORO
MHSLTAIGAVARKSVFVYNCSAELCRRHSFAHPFIPTALSMAAAMSSFSLNPKTARQMRGRHHFPTARPCRLRGTSNLLLAGLIIDHLLLPLILISLANAQQPLESDYEIDLLRRLLPIESRIFGNSMRIGRTAGIKRRQLLTVPPFSSRAPAPERSRPWQTEKKSTIVAGPMPKRNIATGRGDGFRPG